jgi:hypothetical protein
VAQGLQVLMSFDGGGGILPLGWRALDPKQRTHRIVQPPLWEVGRVSTPNNRIGGIRHGVEAHPPGDGG